MNLAIPSGFGRSRIDRNCGYTMLCFRYFNSYVALTND